MATVKLPIDPAAADFLTATFPDFKRAFGTNFPVSGLYYDGAGSTEEKAYWRFKASDYGSGNLSLFIWWYADSGTSGDVRWGARLAAITPDVDTQDIETKAFTTQQFVTDTHLGTTAQRVHTTLLTISNLDALAVDDLVILEISRLPGDAADTLSADAILIDGTELQYENT